MLAMSRIDGFGGNVYAVNPRLAEIDGKPFYPDLAALPEVPDHVVIGVASRFVETVLDQAIDLGVRAATIFASCYLEHDDQPALPARIAAKAAKAGMSLCGANCWVFTHPPLACAWPAPPHRKGCNRAALLGSHSQARPLAHYHIMTGGLASP